MALTETNKKMNDFNFGNDSPPPLTVQIRGIRKKIDGVLQTQDRNTMWMNNAYGHLKNASMMLGNLLGEIGEESPYKGATIQRMNGNSDEIPEQEDKADAIIDLPVPDAIGDRKDIARIDALRNLLSEVIKEVKSVGDQVNQAFARSEHPASEFQSRWVSSCYERSVQELMLSRNWFGVALGGIRDRRKHSQR